MIKLCTIIGCGAKRNGLDRFFCPKHRDNWQYFSYDLGFDEVTSQETVEKALILFVDRFGVGGVPVSS